MITVLPGSPDLAAFRQWSGSPFRPVAASSRHFPSREESLLRLMFNLAKQGVYQEETTCQEKSSSATDEYPCYSFAIAVLERVVIHSLEFTISKHSADVLLSTTRACPM